MKILLAIIITATFSFGCAMLEGEQTTTDSGGGGTTPAPSAPTVSNWSGTKQLGTSGGDSAKGIATDSSGNVYLTGNAGGNLDSGTIGGSNNLFILKYDSGGIKQWTKQFNTSFYTTQRV